MDAEIDQRVHSYPKSRGNRWVVKAGLLTCPRSLRLPGECCPSGKECDEWSLPKEGDLQQRVLSRILTGFPFHPYRIKSDGNHDTAKIAIFLFLVSWIGRRGKWKIFYPTAAQAGSQLSGALSEMEESHSTYSGRSSPRGAFAYVFLRELPGALMRKRQRSIIRPLPFSVELEKYLICSLRSR